MVAEPLGRVEVGAHHAPVEAVEEQAVLRVEAAQHAREAVVEGRHALVGEAAEAEVGHAIAEGAD